MNDVIRNWNTAGVSVLLQWEWQPEDTGGDSVDNSSLFQPLKEALQDMAVCAGHIPASAAVMK